jgi:hypothetical protein
MNNSVIGTIKTVSKAQKARNDHRQFLKALRLTVPAPTLHADNPLLADTADDQLNKLAHQYQGRLLKVEIPAFEIEADPGRQGLVYLMWDAVRQGPAQYSFKTPIAAGAFPIQLTLPAEATLFSGPHNLTYVVNLGGNTTTSDPLPIFIDQGAPNFGQAGPLVTLPPEVESQGITKEYLEANGSVVITVPEYNDKKIGDVVTVYFGKTPQSAAVVATVTRADTTAPVNVSLTTAQVGTEEGEKWIFYKLEDRVGNAGPNSAFKPVRVVLTAAPIDLEPLTVPLAGDGLIDMVDANVGVQVQIEAYTNFVPGDMAVVTWDGLPVTAAPIAGTGPSLVTVPYATLLNGNKDEKTVNVTYVIKRGDLTYPEGTTVPVNVDLRTPGPVNPDDPDPVNPALDLVEVLGATSQTPNTLTIDDAGQAATATVVLYDGFKADDVMQLYWSGVEVPDSGDPAVAGGTYVVTGSEAADFKVQFSIPWTIIETAGNNKALPVRYSIAHPSVNEAVIFSEDQPVEVSVKQVTLPKAEFLNLDPDFPDFLNCNSLREISGQGWVVEISVPSGEPKLADQKLDFHFAGHNDKDDVNVVYNFQKIPTANEAANGFVVYLPYEPPLIETRDGPGSIQYSAVIDGFNVSSEPHEVTVFMATVGPGAPTCNLLGMRSRK